MRLGFMIYSLGRALAAKALSVPEAFALMKDLGAEGVDITGGHVAEYTNAQVKQMVEDAGLVVSCYIGGAALTMSDLAAQAAGIDKIRQAIDTAVELETSSMLVTTGGCAQGQEKAEGRRNAALALREVIPYANSAGVTLSIEDFGSPLAPYQTSAECLEFCEMAGAELKMTYDSGNMVMGDEDPVEFLENTGRLTVHAHAKDWMLLPSDADYGLTARSGKKYIGTVVGAGVLDYPAIIRTLKAMDYQGFLSFEYEGRDDPIAAARQGMTYLQELMAT